MSDLLDAAKKGQLEKVQKLLAGGEGKKPADVNCQDRVRVATCARRRAPMTRAISAALCATLSQPTQRRRPPLVEGVRFGGGKRRSGRRCMREGGDTGVVSVRARALPSRAARARSRCRAPAVVRLGRVGLSSMIHNF
eukprot:317918-Prymnesium_polylepis.1